MTIGTLLLLVSLSAPAAVATQSPSAAALAEAYNLFLQARSLEAQDKVAEAVVALRRAIEVLPTAAELRAELAGLYARESRADLSVAEAEAALRIDPANREAHRILGFVQAALADRAGSRAEAALLVEQAVGHLEATLKDSAHDPGVELTLGRLYVMTGQHEKGIVTLRRFLLGQPGYTEGMLLLAEAYDASGKTGEAIALLEGVAKQSPTEVGARSWLAELYERSDRWGDAASAWGALAQPGSGGALYRLRQATALVNGGDVAGGRAVLTTLTRESPDDASAWYLLSQVELREGRLAEAESAARRIIALDAADPRGQLTLADVLAARDDFGAIVALLKPRVESPPAGDLRSGVHGRLASALALAHEAQGDSAGSIAVLEAARGRVPADDNVLYDLGAAYERARRLDASERAFRELIARAPEHAGGLNYLGYMLADRGSQLDEATGFIQRALVIEPGNPSYKDSLGWAYFKQGRFDEARGLLEQAAAAMTSISLVQDHLGDAYFQLKRYRDAADAYDRALAGDMAMLDVVAVTKKRDRARELAGR